MDDIYGFITPEDAERLRSLNVIAYNNVANDDSDDEALREHLTPKEIEENKLKVKDSFNWPDLIGVSGSVSTKPAENKNSEDLEDDLGAKMSPISEDDDDDIFVDNSELKAVVKVYYERTREAVIPQAVDMDILPPNKFKYFKEYILVSYDVDDFVTHIRKYSQYD